MASRIGWGLRRLRSFREPVGRFRTWPGEPGIHQSSHTAQCGFLFVIAAWAARRLRIYVNASHSYQASASMLLTSVPTRQPDGGPPTTRPLQRPQRWLSLPCKSWGYRKPPASSSTPTPPRPSPTGRCPSQPVRRRLTRLCFTQVPRARPSSIPGGSAAGQQNLVPESLEAQLNQAEQRINSINAQLSQLSSQPLHPRSSRNSATPGGTNQCDSHAVQPSGRPSPATSRLPLPACGGIENSQVLSVTPLPHSKKKKLITYGAIGLVGGLALGLTIVSCGPWCPIDYADGMTSRMRSTLPSSSVSDVGRTPLATGLAWPGSQARP